MSTPPLARAVAGIVGVPPPVIVTAGAVKPKPVSSTAMLLMTPSEIAAVAAAVAVGVTPGDVIATSGGDV